MSQVVAVRFAVPGWRFDEIAVTAHETRLRKIREVIAERRRYLEILG